MEVSGRRVTIASGTGHEPESRDEGTVCGTEQQPNIENETSVHGTQCRPELGKKPTVCGTQHKPESSEEITAPCTQQKPESSGCTNVRDTQRKSESRNETVIIGIQHQLESSEKTAVPSTKHKFGSSIVNTASGTQHKSESIVEISVPCIKNNMELNENIYVAGTQHEPESRKNTQYKPDTRETVSVSITQHEPDTREIVSVSGTQHEPDTREAVFVSGTQHKPDTREIASVSGTQHEPDTREAVFVSGTQHKPDTREIASVSGTQHEPDTREIASVSGTKHEPDTRENVPVSCTQHEPKSSGKISVPGIKYEPESSEKIVVPGTQHKPELGEAITVPGAENKTESKENTSVTGTQHVSDLHEEITWTQQCEQCKDDGHVINAAGFCSECNDFLCINCIQLHKKFRGTKDHKVLEGGAMPSEKQLKMEEEQCPQHPGRLTELYCQSHKTLGCGLCFSVGHRYCSRIKLISDLSTDFDTSNDMKVTLETFEQQKDLVHSCNKILKECQELNSTCYDRSLGDFKSYRSKVEDMLDLLEETVSSETDQMKERNAKRLKVFTDQVVLMKNELESLVADIDDKLKKKAMDQLFIAVKRNAERMERIKTKLRQLKASIQIQTYMFEPGRHLEEAIQTQENLGRIIVFSDELHSYPDEINAWYCNQCKTCGINGIVQISPSELVVTDEQNQDVKKINLKRNHISQRLYFESSPFGIAVLPDGRLVVTFPKQQQLQIITSKKFMTVSDSVDVGLSCYAVNSMGDKLAILINRPETVVKILDLTGIVYKSFINPLNRVHAPVQFTACVCMCISPDHTSIYICDNFSDTVLSISAADGSVQWQYKDSKLNWARGIATGRGGSVYVCSSQNHRIHVLSAEGLKQKIIQTKLYNLRQPKAICVSSLPDVIYLSSESDNWDKGNTIKRLPLQGHMKFRPEKKAADETV